MDMDLRPNWTVCNGREAPECKVCTLVKYVNEHTHIYYAPENTNWPRLPGLDKLRICISEAQCSLVVSGGRTKKRE